MGAFHVVYMFVCVCVWGGGGGWGGGGTVPFIYTYDILSLYFIFSHYTSFNFLAARKSTVESPLKATYLSTAYCSFWFFFR